MSVDRPQRGADGWIAAALALGTALIRLPALRALPIFGDEAIHLHWAQLIRKDFGRFAFVSLQDPKPPLHFWLLALALPSASDPVMAGRLLSVVCGAIATGMFFLLVRDISRAAGADAPTARTDAFCSAVLFLFCPFIAFHQRMVLTESLFVLEAVAAGWLSLRLALAARRGQPIARRAFALGAALGLAMLTRQDFSYVLWALPVLAWWMLGSPRRGVARSAAVACLTALVVWSPVFVSATGPDWKTRVFYSAVYREPISLFERVHNTVELLGWLVFYLTPPVAVLALLGAFVLARRHARAAIFLAGWWAVAIAPLPIFASHLFPRYALAGALPVLIASGIALAGAVRQWRQRRPAIAMAVVLLALAWPVADLVRTWRNPSDPPLVAIDRWQYVSGWPAGSATESAVARIRRESAREPLLLIAPQISGNPGDTVWVLLSGKPGMALRTAVDYLDGPVLRPDAGGGPLAGGDFRAGEPELPLGVTAKPILFIATDPLATRSGWVSAREFLAMRNPGIREVARFLNPPDATRPPAGIVVFRLR